MTTSARVADRRCLRPIEAAAYLGVSRRKLDELPIRRVRLGHRTVRFDLRDLDLYIESRKDPMLEAAVA